MGGSGKRDRRAIPADADHRAFRRVVSFWRMVTQRDRFDEPNRSQPVPGVKAAAPVPPVSVAAAQTTLPVRVRTLSLRDVPRLRSLDSLFPLSQPEMSVIGYDPMRAGVRAAAPWGRARRPAFVADSGQRLVGFAEFRTLAFDGRWSLVAIGASVGVYAADPVWEVLLPFAVRQAGLGGVKRLYARLPWSVGASAAFRRVGWNPYATETVFLANDIAAPPRGKFRPRRQDRTDTWAVHQLYAACVPRGVQEAEAFTSHRWDVVPVGRGAADHVTGWLFEDDHRLVGYARALSIGARHALEVLVLPERRELATAIVDGALAALGSSGLRRVYCAVRGYQPELLDPLEERGFLAVFEQELFVRYTTATIRTPAVEPVPFVLDVRDPVPSRLPSFVLAAEPEGAIGKNRKGAAWANPDLARRERA